MKRQDFLAHVGWTGAGVAFSLTQFGVVRAADALPDGPYFVQISDSHIGFHQPANMDVAGTLKSAVAGINGLPNQPDFVIHTGDVTHLAKPEQFDTAKQILGTLRAPLVVLPGEHDALSGGLAAFLSAFPPKSGSAGMVFLGCARRALRCARERVRFRADGTARQEQLAWLERDLAGLPATRPVVVFTHVPLYALYPQWGWTTEDGSKALALLQRFDAVTVLNGHIHQVIEHKEGNISFASANATAYPQPVPGTAPKPGPLALPPDQLLHRIGYRTVELHAGAAATHDVTLG